MLTESAFGRSVVESRLNVSKEHTQYHTLECVASTEEEEAYTLFSISGMTCTHTYTMHCSVYIESAHRELIQQGRHCQGWAGGGGLSRIYLNDIVEISHRPCVCRGQVCVYWVQIE